MNNFVGQAFSLAFQHYNETKAETERFEIEKVLKAFISNHNNKVHTVTGEKPNKLILTENEEQISSVNRKIKIFYNKQNSRNNKKSLKVGIKVYIVGVITIDEAQNLIFSPESKRNKAFPQKGEKGNKVKIAAEVQSVDQLNLNKVTIMVYGGKLPKSVKINYVYNIKTNCLAIANEREWNSLVKISNCK